MAHGLIAQAAVVINAPKAVVWNALTNPEAIKQYMFGATVVSEWREGSEIRWKGEWHGKPYEDKGKILRFEPGRRLQYSHFSPLSGLPDIPENYHTVTIELSEQPDDVSATQVVLTQDNNRTDEAREHSEKNWQMMLQGLRAVVEP